MKHMKHHDGHMGHKSHDHMYKHGEDEPHVPAHGHQEHGMGVSDFKGQAQFKNYHWDSDTGGASGY